MGIGRPCTVATCCGLSDARRRKVLPRTHPLPRSCRRIDAVDAVCRPRHGHGCQCTGGQRTCSDAGARGTAVDAAIAVQMMLTLVEPRSSGIGGGEFLLHYGSATARSRRPTVAKRPCRSHSGHVLNASGQATCVYKRRRRRTVCRHARRPEALRGRARQTRQTALGDAVRARHRARGAWLSDLAAAPHADCRHGRAPVHGEGGCRLLPRGRTCHAKDARTLLQMQSSAGTLRHSHPEAPRPSTPVQSGTPSFNRAHPSDQSRPADAR